MLLGSFSLKLWAACWRLLWRWIADRFLQVLLQVLHPSHQLVAGGNALGDVLRNVRRDQQDQLLALRTQCGLTEQQAEVRDIANQGNASARRIAAVADDAA